ncbi:hypothetical protein [Carboxylicivirga sp. M1479]|nr:hypothetical protein [Carboxylicivirga sp. M1479]
MQYLHEIGWYMALPITIIVSYYAVLWGIKKFEKLPQAQKETKED